MIKKAFAWIYELTLREKATPSILGFFNNFYNLAMGYGFAAVFVIIFQVIAGRLLGPAEYGKYVLVDSIAIFLYIFMSFGLSISMVRYSAENQDHLTNKKIISTTYLLTLLFSLIACVIFLLLSEVLSSFLNVSYGILKISVFFAVFYSLYILATDTLRGLHGIKSLSFLRVLYGLSIVVFLLGAILFLHNFSFLSAVLAISLGYLTTFSIVIFLVRDYLYFKIDKVLAKKILEYGLYAVVGSSLFLLLPSLNKILVNKFLTVSDVGIYNAYHFGSLNIMVFLSTVFIAVFFPAASKRLSKSPILRIIKKTTLPILIIGTPCVFIFELIILKLFGRQYPIDYWLMFLFALSGVVFFIYNLYSWLFYSKGIKDARFMMFASSLILSINIALSFYLIPNFLLKGAALSLIITYSFGWFYLSLYQKKLLD